MQIEEDAAYIRYSDHKQDDGFSVEYQTREITEYAQNHGVEITRFFVDKAQTATKVSGREDFFALINAVKKGEIKTIYVYKLSRMFRNTLESSKYRELFRKHGVKLISVTQAVDEETSSGRLTTNIMASVDQYHSENLSDHVKSSMREMARQGFYTGGRVRFGLMLVEPENSTKGRKKFAPHPSESLIVRKVFQMSADGFSGGQIRNYLNENGYRTQEGKLFGSSYIARLIQDDIYIGTYRFKTEGYDDIVVENCIPAIIDRETFEKANQMKEKNRVNNSPNPRQTQRFYPLTGKLKCGYCGSPLTGFSSKRNFNGRTREYLYYVCKQRKVYKNCKCKFLSKDFAEENTLKAITSLILNDEKIKDIAVIAAKLVEDSPLDLDAQLKEYQQNKTKLERSIENLVDMLADGTASEAMKLRVVKMESELQKVNKKIKSLTAQKKNLVTADSVESYMREMLKKTTSGNAEEIKIIFDNFVEEIIVFDDDFRIRLNAFASQLTEADSIPIIPLETKIRKD